MPYDWIRYWCRRGSTLEMDDGYLLDPETGWGQLAAGELRTLDALRDKRCLILLGEAGIGKSTELKCITGNPSDRPIVALDLGDYGDEEALDRDLRNSPQVQAWLEGRGEITILLDSLDEMLIDRPRAIGFLKRWLRSIAVDRLYLRITCRSAAWPETLSKNLAEVFNEEQVSVWELAPLRREDVAEAARAERLDVEAFLQQLGDLHVQSLACNPTTLQMLINIWRQENRLPGSAVELFRRGLAQLCTPSDERRDRLPPRRTPRQLLNVAGRIAALSVFTKRPVIRNGLVLDHEGQEELSIDELNGGPEGPEGSTVEVDAQVLHEVFATGLFSAKGEGRIGFAHKTYAEFLAAQYLVNHRITDQLRDSILFVRDESPPHLIPQLRETGAWVASMDNAFAQLLLEREPETLLSSDVAIRDDRLKPRLFDAIVQRIEQRSISYWDEFGFSQIVRGLRYDGLRDRVLHVLRDQQRPIDVRLFAIRVAEVCAITALSEPLARVALNNQERYRLRVDSARAVLQLDVPTARELLRPLALGEAGDDADDELRGYGLRATWPRYLTPAELFQSLTLEQNPFHAGAYCLFISQLERKLQLSPQDIPMALVWLQQFLGHEFRHGSFSRLGARIAELAWDNLEDPAILAAFADWAVVCIRTYESIFVQPGRSGPEDGHLPAKFQEQQDHTRRRLLISAVLERLVKPDDAAMLVFGRTNLSIRDDFAWALENACQHTGDRARTWAHFASCVRDWTVTSHYESWMEAKAKSAEVAEVMNLPEKIELDTPQAEKLKSDWAKKQEIMANRNVPDKVIPSLVDRIQYPLEACLGDTPDAFWWLVNELSVNTERLSNDIFDDVKETPGWGATDAETQMKIVFAAKRFLESAQLDSAKVLEREEHYLSELAPHWALRLILEEEPAFLDTLPLKRWECFAPFVFVNYLGGELDGEPARQVIAQTIYDRVPDACRPIILRILERSKALLNQSCVLECVSDRFDSDLAAGVLALFEEGGFCAKQFAGALYWLLDHGHEPARAYALKLIEHDLRANDDDRALSIEAAVLLLSLFPSAENWPAIWPQILSHPDWGRKVVSQLADVLDRDRSEWLKVLSDKQASDLLVWLFEQFPPASDPREGGVRFVGPDERARRFREQLLLELQRRGTFDACEALRSLSESHPENSWLQAVVLRARKERRRMSWEPPSPREFRQLVLDRSKRFISSPSQLLEVVLESLHRLQSEIQGTTPAVKNLWNEYSNGVCRPKEEDHLSDYVKLFLQRDLAERRIVANREVQVRRRQSKGGAPGQDLDILVQAIAPADRVVDPLLSLVIEVKGCWHREVRTAMKTQLVDRYLQEYQCRHGLYLVGWFHAATWDNRDRRNRHVPWATIEEANNELNTQAEALHRESVPDGALGAFVLDCSLA